MGGEVECTLKFVLFAFVFLFENKNWVLHMQYTAPTFLKEVSSMHCEQMNHLILKKHLINLFILKIRLSSPAF